MHKIQIIFGENIKKIYIFVTSCSFGSTVKKIDNKIIVRQGWACYAYISMWLQYIIKDNK
jgi:hypothetical protein